MVRAIAGLIVLVGVWGAAIPYVGPLFGYSMPPGSDQPAFAWTASHWQLHLVPGLVAVVGGLLLFGRRALAFLGGLLALAAGTWFVIGNEFARAGLLGDGGGGGMQPEASTFLLVVTPLGYHDGTGLVIAALATLALGLLAARRRRAEEDIEIEEVDREPARERVPAGA